MRLAQGETHLIQQSTAWLEEHGVSLEALQAAAQSGPRGGGGEGGSGGGGEGGGLKTTQDPSSIVEAESKLAAEGDMHPGFEYVHPPAAVASEA